MNQLLKKFEKIEIDNTSCLDREDQRFCQTQQHMYESALRHYRAMFRGMKMLHDKETEFHSKLDEKNVSSHNILPQESNHCRYKYTDGSYYIYTPGTGRAYFYLFPFRYGLDLSAGTYEKYISIQEPEKPAFSFESSASYFSEAGRRGRKEKRKQYEAEYQAYQEEMLLRSKLDYHVIIDDIFSIWMDLILKKNYNRKSGRKLKMRWSIEIITLQMPKISFTA